MPNLGTSTHASPPPETSFLMPTTKCAFGDTAAIESNGNVLSRKPTIEIQDFRMSSDTFLRSPELKVPIPPPISQTSSGSPKGHQHHVLSGSSSRFDSWELDALINDDFRDVDNAKSYSPQWLEALHRYLSFRINQTHSPTLLFVFAALWAIYTLLFFVIAVLWSPSWYVLPPVVSSFLTTFCAVISLRRRSPIVLFWGLRVTILVVPIINHFAFCGTGHSGGALLASVLQFLLSALPQSDAVCIPGFRSVFYATIIAAAISEPYLGTNHPPPSPAPIFSILSLVLVLTFLAIAMACTRLIFVHTIQQLSASLRVWSGARATAVIDKDGVIHSGNVYFMYLFGECIVGKNLLAFVADGNHTLAEFLADGTHRSTLLPKVFFLRMVVKGSKMRCVFLRCIPYTADLFLLEAYDVSEGIDISVDKGVVEGIIGDMPQPVVVVNDQYQILMANEHARSLLPPSDVDVLGLDLRRIASQLGAVPESMTYCANANAEGSRRQQPGALIATASSCVEDGRANVVSTGLSFTATDCKTLSGRRMLVAVLQKNTLNAGDTPSDPQPVPGAPASISYDRLLDGLLNTMANGVVIADETMTIRRVNPAIVRLFGYAEHELVGRSVGCLMPGDLAAKHMDWVTRYLKSGKPHVIGTCGRRVHARHKNGTPLSLSLTLSEGNAIAGIRMFTGVLHDMKHELEAQETELVEKISELKVESQQHFIQYLFHVLRNPLNGVSKGVELLTQALTFQPTRPVSFEEQCATALTESQLVADSVAQTLHIMDNLLDVYNLQSKKEFLAQVPFSLVEQLRHTSACVRHLLHPGVALHTVASFDDVQLLGSPYHLQQILVNLLTNAAQHTKQGFIQLNALLVKRTASDITVQIQVVDTGGGMSEDQRMLVLKQKDSIALRIGTGLGLTISQNLVRLMGGTLEIQSPWRRGLQIERSTSSGIPTTSSSFRSDRSGTAGQNSTDSLVQGSMLYFTVRFDLATEQKAEKAEALPSNISVLVVDDLALNRRLWRIIFTSGPFLPLKWKIDDVEDGEDALERIKEDGKEYNIVILDEHLGPDKKRGREVAKILREWERVNQLTPMILIGASGNCTNEDRELALEAGQDLFYGKPYPTAEEVMRDVGAILRKRLVRTQQFCRPVELFADFPDLTVVNSDILAASGLGDSTHIDLNTPPFGSQQHQQHPFNRKQGSPNSLGPVESSIAIASSLTAPPAPLAVILPQSSRQSFLAVDAPPSPNEEIHHSYSFRAPLPLPMLMPPPPISLPSIPTLGQGQSPGLGVSIPVVGGGGSRTPRNYSEMSVVGSLTNSSDGGGVSGVSGGGGGRGLSPGHCARPPLSRQMSLASSAHRGSFMMGGGDSSSPEASPRQRRPTILPAPVHRFVPKTVPRNTTFCDLGRPVMM